MGHSPITRSSIIAVLLPPKIRLVYLYRLSHVILAFCSTHITLQQQQQQHTLLTFPKGAFQRQCYKNNPITIKNPIYN